MQTFDSICPACFAVVAPVPFDIPPEAFPIICLCGECAAFFAAVDRTHTRHATPAELRDYKRRHPTPHPSIQQWHDRVVAKFWG